VAKPGYSRIAALVALNAVVWLFVPGTWRYVCGSAALVLLLLIINFYRDPERHVPHREGSFVVSPADGRIVLIDKAHGRLSISIFLSAFDVHVNRAPVSGRVVELSHTPGKYLPAFLATSSSENERVRLTLEDAAGRRVSCTQVAGLLARRIENWVAEGQNLAQGERYGMIHLGSRLDLELDGSYEPLVAKGQYVRGGLAVLAEIPGG
jgi:phosphatidylserine decarboxylase